MIAQVHAGEMDRAGCADAMGLRALLADSAVFNLGGIHVYGATNGKQVVDTIKRNMSELVRHANQVTNTGLRPNQVVR